MTNESRAILIVAGGSGTRMQAECPKQYIPLHGKPIIRHTIEKLMPFGDVYCVIGQGHEDFYHQAVDGLDLPPPIIGGNTRQDSVRRGLQAIADFNPEYVLIHDAARPCFDPQNIHNLIQALKPDRGVTLAMPVTESLQRADGQAVDRYNLWVLQTPQGFPYPMIVAAHDKAARQGITATDDTALLRSNDGGQIDYIPCGRHNVKITTQDDLKMAEKLMQMEYRTGMGFDVHAFDTETDAAATTTIRLGGIDIPHDRALMGHSDADVGLHALTDAILGAMAAGDIGSHFPPSNQDFKDMDSHVFLDHAVDMLVDKGGKIIHLDLTYICEEPKIGKHRQAMQSHLASHLSLSTDRVSIKATTSERLGFTGRGEGIAAQAVVTIQVPAS